MFNVVFDSLKRATEMSLQTQQEAFKKWAGISPGAPVGPIVIPQQAQAFRQKWAEFFGEALKKQREVIEVQFKAGLKNIEEAFKLAECKEPAELRAKTLELWQKVFEALHQASEAQVRDLQSLAARWTELVTKGTA